MNNNLNLSHMMYVWLILLGCLSCGNVTQSVNSSENAVNPVKPTVVAQSTTSPTSAQVGEVQEINAPNSFETVVKETDLESEIDKNVQDAITKTETAVDIASKQTSAQSSESKHKVTESKKPIQEKNTEKVTSTSLINQVDSESKSAEAIVENQNLATSKEDVESSSEEIDLDPKQDTASIQASIEDDKVEVPKEQEIFSHEAFDNLLQTYVSSRGKVDYPGLKKNEAALDAYLAAASSQDPNTMNRNQGLAYWINVYNAFTIKLILDHYPTSSIMNIYGGKAWDQKWIEIHGQSYSLNDIEHTIIRPTYQDARIHFAVNCAASSCPPLLNKAYTGRNVDTLLDQVTRQFITNPAYNTITSAEVKLSKIFEWYKEDFGDLIAYLNQYTKEPIGTGATISFNEYDWTLNQ